jgi:predicted O-methyltransferase YrrM
MSRTAPGRRHWKDQIKPWVPPALLELYRRKRRNPAPMYQPDAQFTLPVRTLPELFPDRHPDAVQIPISQMQRQDEWMVPAAELLNLAAVCAYARPGRVFEIGTYTGSSTLILAMNTPPATEIFTIDIDPSDRATHQHGLGIGGFPAFTVGAAYRETAFAGKIHQLLGSSQTFDFTPFAGSIDLVFVDADHTYDFVKADTATALKLLRPGGVIVWDDYMWNERHPECAGVTRCVNELAKTRPIFRLDGTRFAIYVDSVYSIRRKD